MWQYYAPKKEREKKGEGGPPREKGRKGNQSRSHFVGHDVAGSGVDPFLKASCSERSQASGIGGGGESGPGGAYSPKVQRTEHGGSLFCPFFLRPFYGQKTPCQAREKGGVLSQTAMACSKVGKKQVQKSRAQEVAEREERNEKDFDAEGLKMAWQKGIACLFWRCRIPVGGEGR